MKQLAFKMQVVTPLFLSGADQHVAELRPPSIRGALRFWFRAMMRKLGNKKTLDDCIAVLCSSWGRFGDAMCSNAS
jgi:CRISPR type III-B/RAMP module RAMP protein Cmr1